MKKLLLSIAALLGFTFFASATPVQKNDVSALPVQEELVANLETATVDQYGAVDLGITFESLPEGYSLAGDIGCGNSCHGYCC